MRERSLGDPLFTLFRMVKSEASSMQWDSTNRAENRSCLATPDLCSWPLICKRAELRATVQMTQQRHCTFECLIVTMLGNARFI